MTQSKNVNKSPLKKSKQNIKKNRPIKVDDDASRESIAAVEAIKRQAILACPSTASILTNGDRSDAERSTAIASIEKKITQIVSAMEPRDSHETILMQNMVTAQDWMSHCFSKASRLMDSTHCPTLEHGTKLMKIGTNFMNLYTKQLDALDRHRQIQSNKVWRVEVNNGGQAIVGDVTIHQEKKENE